MKSNISIDKIVVRLKSHNFPVVDVLKMDKYLANSRCGYEVFKCSQSNTNKPFTYVYNCELWDGKGTKMLLNFFRRDLDGKIKPYCEFHFNPNKHYEDFPKVLSMLKWLGFVCIDEIPRVDIAVDFPVSPNEVEILVNRPLTIINNTGDNYSRYKRYADGSMMRIYNKAIEEGSKIPKTRCELVLKNWISQKHDNFNTLWQHFSDIYIRDIECMPNLPKAVVYALQNFPSCKLRDYIPLLSPKQRDEAQRYFQSVFKRYHFTLDDYAYICNLLLIYLPMLKEQNI